MKLKYSLIINFLIILSCILAVERVKSQSKSTSDWRSDWAVEQGFSLNVDTEGYHFPTAIAFVPNPGQGDKDPLYFVTELRGKVKVVTNDRTVYTFAENFFPLALTPEDELSSPVLQVGIAGICLEPKHGYVFITFAYHTLNKSMRNNVIRFQAKPETFSIKAESHVSYTNIFLPYEAGVHHQIGPCQINDELLYVSVGDAYQPVQSQNVHSMLGKIIRMTLDGKVVSDNPFYQNDDQNKAINYIWAYGFRNPFSLKIVKDRVFAADNGNNIDRFLEIREGKNYHWNGNDWSIATDAAFVFVPSVGPVQLDYYPDGSTFFPEEYRQTFFLAVSATEKDKMPGIMTLKYGLTENKMLSIPKYILKYLGNGDEQSVVGLAFGPDGLYFSPLLPSKEGRNPILKLSYDPTSTSSFALISDEDPLRLMSKYGCLGCHTLNTQYGQGGAVGPPLDRTPLINSIKERINSKAYLESIKEIDSFDREPFRSFISARKEVVEADGMEKVRVWMKYHILQPKFDNPHSRMPSVGLSEKESQIITDYLLGTSDKIVKLKLAIVQYLPFPIRPKHLFLFFIMGFGVALLIAILPRFAKRLR